MIILIAQIICQGAWGVFCFFTSPHNLMLTLLNASLVAIALVAKLDPEDGELRFMRLYLATWVIPGFIVLLSMVANLFETENSVLTSVGVAPIATVHLLGGSSGAFLLALRNFLVSQMIPMVFKALSCAHYLFRNRA